MNILLPLANVLKQNQFENALTYAMGNVYALSDMRKSYGEAKTVLGIASRLQNFSILYRLNQIRELTQVDLDDAITRMNYLNALILREYLVEAQ